MSGASATRRRRENQSFRGKTSRKETATKTWAQMEDNTEMDRIRIGCKDGGGGGWIHMAQDRETNVRMQLGNLSF
jgi:hypothetical protein